MSTFFSAFIYLCEGLTCFFYFENTLQPKRKLPIRISLYFLASALQFCCGLLSIPAMNLTTFVASVFILTLLLYKTRLRTCIFQTILVSALMLITEFISVYVFTLAFRANIDIYANSLIVRIVQGSTSKLLFFLALYAVARIVFHNEKRTDKIRTLALGFFPASSILLLWLFYDLAVVYEISFQYAVWFMSGTILLLLSNFIVFAVYESTQKIHWQFTQSQLELQKEKISTEYYELLQQEHENSRILAHDMKGHLRILKDLAAEGRSDDIGRYIENLNDDIYSHERVVYSGNRFEDVILNRYAQLCREQFVRLDMDVRCASLDFMSGSDITSLLDNMLSNAVEAAVDSAGKQIELMVSEQNVNFIVIRLCNSCDIAPNIANGKLHSRKSSEGMHGFGLKSIKRIAAKYDGEVTWEYRPELAEFDLRVILSKR